MEEDTGPKFTTSFLKKEVPKSDQAKELLNWCYVLAKYNEGTSGNLSFRTENGCIITGTGTDLGKATIYDLVEVTGFNEEKKEIQAKGIKEPSSEAFLHLKIYQKIGKINAVFHGHTLDIPNVPVTDKEYPYGTLELADSVADLAEKTNFLIAKNHGFFSLGRTMDDAGKQIINKIN
ncbi:class II aldolase/adducin family protein [Patescibacteria group bacterium]|nr:class II aldolase/adducin family protein [Patescibacteria group bacterium]MBU1673697.1 class II aldolase/adducin family protein [Patescibacteria group bacterium]MBU1963074.1 class II aldolase/adducin family protein [Patescibacteria group bacterium]